MKPPMLRVRRDAGRDSPGLYRVGSEGEPAAGERDRRREDERAREPRRSGRRGAVVGSLLAGRLTFIAVLVLVIGAFALLRFAGNRKPDRATLSGWQVSLSATVVDGSLSASLSFRPRGRQARPAAAASVRFFLPETGGEARVGETLVQDPVVARVVLPLTGVEKRLQADVRIAGATATLSASIRQP
ncbi:MAG TPA: hypothetical protein VFH83_05550 [Spirochaetia bacterium]|nr:hypothetical protein [Spirochaetia bacterium]